ncbi:MAG: hypothetical protein IIW88_00550 [Clostridia bacterium]|nr:hypothetical protein [Clostridia bacterium]
MKKEVMAAIAAALAIWFFVMGFELGIFKERRAQAKLAAQTTNPIIATSDFNVQLPTVTPTAPTAPGNNVTVPSTMPTIPGNDVTVAPSGKEISSLSTDEILTDVGNAINTLKQTPNFTALRKLQVVVKVVDCSVPSAIEKINEIITDVTSKAVPEETIVFTNGNAVNSKGEQLTPFSAVPPENNSFTLTSAGVASARAEKQGDNKVYFINLNPESTTAESPIPVHNAGSLGFLNIESLGLPSIVNITRANMNYPGSMMQVTLDKDGKLIHLRNYLPMTGDGEAKVMGLGGSAKFEGYLNEEWTIAY